MLKVWADIPSNCKVLPFRKTFSKNVKTFFLDGLPKVRRTRIIVRPRKTQEEYTNMMALFEESFDQNQDEFLGFDLKFEALFNSSCENDDTFLGFDLEFEALFENMMVLFEESTDQSQEEFLGFDLKFEALFNSSCENDQTFLGFDLVLEALLDSSNESENTFHGF